MANVIHITNSNLQSPICNFDQTNLATDKLFLNQYNIHIHTQELSITYLNAIMLTKPSPSFTLPSLFPTYRTWTRSFASVTPVRLPKKQAPRLNPTRAVDPSIRLKLFPSKATPLFSSTSPYRVYQTRQLSTMSSVKEYSLFCLENPLLGKLCFIQSPKNKQLSMPVPLKLNLLPAYTNMFHIDQLLTCYLLVSCRHPGSG
jgi:hypothetical protein